MKKTRIVSNAANRREGLLMLCKFCQDSGLRIYADAENGPEFDCEAPCDCAAGDRLIDRWNRLEAYVVTTGIDIVAYVNGEFRFCADAVRVS